MTTHKFMLVGFAILTGTFCVWTSAAQSDSSRSTAPKTSNETTNAGPSGEQLFQTHCVRCHQPPEAISSREARAVVRHMRMRATLSERDEQLLLKFLAP